MKGIVESVDFFGQGIVRENGKCCFIADALTGETVEYEITEEKKNYGRGRSLSVSRPSLQRVAPPCPYYGRCGGCQFQHMDYPAECTAKEEHVRHCLSRAGVDESVIAPLTRAESTFGYRNKAVLHVRDGVAGYLGAGGGVFVPITRCLLLEPALNRALACLSVLGCAGAETVTLRGDSRGRVVVALTGVVEPDWPRALMAMDDEITGVSLPDGKRVGDCELMMELGDLRLTLLPESFFQINTAMAHTLLKDLRQQTGEGGTVLDLYCGVGTVGLFLADRFQQVCGIDVVPQAIEAARRNAVENQVQARYLAGKAEHTLEQLLTEAPRAELVIVDPPRQGLAPNVSQTLAAYGAPRLLYISCDPATLSRDLKTLSATYTVIAAAPYDLFPRTAHVETVVQLSRKTPNDVIHVDLDLTDLPITKAEAAATYTQIKEYILEQTGMKVSSLYVSQVKRKCSLEVGDSYNKPKSDDKKQPQCPPDKEAAIMAALKHYKMI